MITLLFVLGFVLALYPAAKLGEWIGNKLVEWLEAPGGSQRDAVAKEKEWYQHERISL